MFSLPFQAPLALCPLLFNKRQQPCDNICVIEASFYLFRTNELACSNKQFLTDIAYILLSNKNVFDTILKHGKSLNIYLTKSTSCG